jgi:polyketide biosynthesis enoyl-CoA hydratase PksH
VNTLRVEQHGAVLRVTLDRPERQNSIDEALLRELHAVLDGVDRDPGVRVLALTANGPVFCSGMDLAGAGGASGSRGDAAARGGGAFYALLERMTTIDRVVVSMVDGRAAGGGVGLVAASDLVYATERSSFSLPEALWGLLPCCVLPFLVRRVGFQPAYAMTLSTLPVSAERAERIHLVDQVVADPQVPLRSLTARLVRMDQSTPGDAKRYLAHFGPPIASMRDAAVAELVRLMAAPVAVERLTAFAGQGRLPWEG